MGGSGSGDFADLVGGKMMEELERRQKGIGGTDISAIVGLNPWRTALDIWLEKTGQAEPQEDNEAMYWGRKMEPLLAERYEKETDRKIFETPEIIDPNKSWHRGSPDRLVYVYDGVLSRDDPAHVLEGIVELKTSGQPQEWGEPGTDEVPEHYHLQCDYYMGLTGAHWCDLAVLLMGFKREFRIYHINRDQELIDYLIEEARNFWFNYVIPGIPPELDGSESARQYLNRLYPKSQGAMFEPTDPEILITVGKYAHARKQIVNWTEQAAIQEMRLKSFIGDAAGMKGDWGKITWKSGKNGNRRFYPQFKGV